jgi:4-diphosphocytidyl-2-C-methyl-D-erythritol kinase
MLATGRGERLEPIASGGYTLPYPLAVVMPKVRVATAEAYRLVKPSASGRPDLRAVVASNDLDRWRRELMNDFGAPIMARYPEIATERDRLVGAGAGYAAMTGSGAAVFGVFETETAASAAAEAARQRGLTSWWGYAAGRLSVASPGSSSSR